MKIKLGPVLLKSGWKIIGNIELTNNVNNILIEKDGIGAIFEDGKIKRLNQSEYKQYKKEVNK